MSVTEVFCIFFFHFHCMQCMVPDLSAFKQNEVTIPLKSSVVVFTFTRILTEFSCNHWDKITYPKLYLNYVFKGFVKFLRLRSLWEKFLLGWVTLAPNVCYGYHVAFLSYGISNLPLVWKARNYTLSILPFLPHWVFSPAKYSAEVLTIWY